METRRIHPLLRASRTEFRWRWVLFGLIYTAGFSCYSLDPVPVARTLGSALLPLHPGSAARCILYGAAFLVAAAAALRTWAAAYLHSDVVHDTAVHAERLVADGPYRHCRNPLYLGLCLMAAGFGLAASALGCLVITAGNLLLVLRLIGREEADFAALGHHASYAAYLGRVPRLIPSLRPRIAPAGDRPRWGQALAGELPLWLFALGSLLLAVTLKVAVFRDCCWAGLAVYAPLVAASRGRRRTASASSPPAPPSGPS